MWLFTMIELFLNESSHTNNIWAGRRPREDELIQNLSGIDGSDGWLHGFETLAFPLPFPMCDH